MILVIGTPESVLVTISAYHSFLTGFMLKFLFLEIAKEKKMPMLGVMSISELWSSQPDIVWISKHAVMFSPWLAHFILVYSSVGKESACNAGDPGLIPGSGSSPGAGIGYPLQYSWASLVAQMVKNLPAILETWVWSLGWEDPLEKGKATHSSILAWRIAWTV